jgi:peptidyl-prolyl cis-trans isomerase A (cyclophilin A)
MKSLPLLLCMAACAFAQTPPAAAPGGAPAPLKDGLYAIFNTSMGTITVELLEKEAPVTVANFVALAEGKKAWEDPKTKAMVHRPLYTNMVFHRIMMDQMIQSGDPSGGEDKGCGVHVRDEFKPELKFDRPGRLAMANTGEKNSGGCQFFITQVSSAAPWNGSYAIFGQVVEGQDVVKAISRAPLIPGTLKPKTPPKLISVTIKRVGPAPAAEPMHKAPAKKAAPPKQ